MTEADYTILGENIARLLEGQREINARLDRMLDEQQAMRNEMRRLAENQMSTNRSVMGIRDDLTLMIRTELGGLFAHLETRLENRIAEQLAVRS